MVKAEAPREGLRIGGNLRPEPIDPQRAEGWLADLRRAAEAAGCDALLPVLDDGGPQIDRLKAVMDLSPHLRGGLLQHPEWLEALLSASAQDLIAARIADLQALPEEGQGESALMARLRTVKREVSLLIALCDIFGEATPAETTARLSDLAEGAVRAALRFCLVEAHRSGKIVLPKPEEPETGCGLFVLGMGKLGARELNYSSDIDLIVLFDPDAGLVPDAMEAVETLSRLVRRFVRIVGERTGEGYVFRTDLRLRPDPGAMPLAIPVEMALTYYEGNGRNWERAAMIKARPVAGDLAAGEAFLEELSPFVWRRYLDFAAIADIQDMKLRIDRHRGFDAVGVAGHNVKLGRGGIREVEFFAQTQQLIAGGRAPRLRQRRTEEALRELAAGSWVTEATRDELTQDYWFLRRVEHAIQMVDDEQSHTLPEEPDRLEPVARLAGFADRDAFAEALLFHLGRVDGHFAKLFNDGRRRRDEPSDGSSALLRLLESEEDRSALERLAELGYQRPEDIARIVRSWGYGRYRATQSAAARERLSGVLPMLLSAFAGARDPDGALAAFDRFLAGLPAGVQFFALIASNPRILELLAVIITAAPALRETIAARPHVFDAMLDPAFLGEVPGRGLVAERLSAFLADAADYEDKLARLRLFASEQRFLIGARMLSGVIAADEAGSAFSGLADVVLDATLAAVMQEFSDRHGEVAGARIALLGMGRLGSCELTAGSDVDLILLYDHDENAEESDGEKRLPPPVYFTRLTQRLIAALTAPMKEGVLYDVDFRLRPSGNKGPLATHVESFARYQRTEAWTWERMALSRSRAFAGDTGLCDEIAAMIESVLAERQSDPAIGQDVADMRLRIEKSKPARGPLDVKRLSGGLIDLEFIAQWALLTGRADLGLIGAPTDTVLSATDFGGHQGFADLLTAAMRDFTRVIQILRLGPADVARRDDIPEGLADRLASALGLDGAEELEPRLAETASRVRQAFEVLLPAPSQNEPEMPA
ncbi:bifunctional [glutamine synthetase] adenylyltransferase/[glutamine synthetase]-adenylyl-L-tyrosine phosphorylase [Aurantimonas sp. VKM B-3413]|uniref:bifunctional [glutamine synthetase] adenylyltransferase/[glutamine synthetase]-adenylyl-L-tyrosine phosphorylase n=1 Tax=Aurantimonas sp. VKM B-3413 TaxID=2779401 RepID=UPI001E3E9DDC|nr:bifunctional [glutamine synthetase] adenylyltransferase/[glutamine synthetase]-adenylyl-L-tyrosine phosphorylase [Aurantimonas sp. VKM B-3413]MCB8836077.1 bifunctional [glutamine synthetase] adenylyltransferase/[glutamine synthetase]-adenylyl-L-tyrosine phosphorylase [Aurantimonas sp. VKM B-3413]